MNAEFVLPLTCDQSGYFGSWVGDFRFQSKIAKSKIQNASGVHMLVYFFGRRIRRVQRKVCGVFNLFSDFAFDT